MECGGHQRRKFEPQGMGVTLWIFGVTKERQWAHEYIVKQGIISPHILTVILQNLKHLGHVQHRRVERYLTPIFQAKTNLVSEKFKCLPS